MFATHWLHGGIEGDQDSEVWQLARGFWLEFLLRRPAFSKSDGMFPFDPATRVRYIEIQGRTCAAWQARAMAAGLARDDFFRACTRVRAAMY
ncbi:hypothetical protein [Cupriavidus lacunae]|uniref:hypothetical protein n=1 Tax=Cupriavidus lacunae TaxID=2666307 RepID=UPI0010586352|nr:hypothetical protein [Cupriavidus lacunae]